jgi:hypothetical protein
MSAHPVESWPADAQRVRETAAHPSFLLEGAMARAGPEGSSDQVKQAVRIATSILVTP